MLLSKREEGFRDGLLKDGRVAVELTTVGMDMQRPNGLYFFAAGPITGSTAHSTPSQ
jgi:hypothetical protein